MKENVIGTKTFKFSVKIVNLYKSIIDQKKEFVLSRQLVRSGTAKGALVRESEQAESRADFIHKLSIGLKEANETDYWLDLLKESDYISDLEHNEMKEDLGEILKLLTKIIKTSKST
ncbi:four helix bundle protein [Pontixanthobacter gangjinensis]|uniref:Four helix bundle protein n=1 Tax=Christiangramia aestuarii TaxID=1028746 RepID=A0A7K1LNF5_9FLAO|nr:four helix bundle protein [Christiangramia aestuarii]MUP42339.1 four helix bundle protein [Christiangramia aestuarii]